jgi:ankyrin repeat protein
VVASDSSEITRSTGAATTKRLQGLIKALPDTVDAAYDSILKRATNIVLCRRLLHIVLAALRPLTLEEVNVALNIKDSMRRFDDLDLEDEAHFEKTVRNLCGLFVSVVDKKVFLIHQTAREHLVCTDNCMGHDDSRWKHSFFLSESESILATCCILFLHFTDFEIEVEKLFHGRSDENNVEVQHPFHLYAIASWTVHYKEENSDDITNDQALDLCDPSSTHFSTWFHRFIADDDDYDLIRIENQDGVSWTPLLLATYFRFDIMVRRILQRGESVDIGSSSGMTPLMLATTHRNSQIVRILLEAGANVNAVDQYGQTALFYGRGVDDKDDPIKILVEFGADVSHKTHKGTALQMASDERDIGRVRFFLSHEAIDVNAENGEHGTALQTASIWGFVDIAQVLIEHGADVNLNGRNYLGNRLGFPIALAPRRGRKKMMQLLVENGANINAVGGDCESALLAALENRDLETVEWLLENGADLRQATVNKYDSMSSVFSLAAQGRSIDVFEFLINYRPDLYPDSPRYALHVAMKSPWKHYLRLVLDLSLPLSREDLQPALEIECDLDVDFGEIKERRALIQEKLDSMSLSQVRHLERVSNPASARRSTL